MELFAHERSRRFHGGFRAPSHITAAAGILTVGRWGLVVRWCVAGAATATTVPHAVVLEEELLRCSLMRSCRRERKVPLWLLRRIIMMMMMIVLLLVLLVLVLPVRRLVLRVGL